MLSFYGKVLFHPDKYIFNGTGDALKNYFTYASHIKHDSTYVQFQGMNYPYGEHFLYTDCHPALANALKFVSSEFNFFSNYSIGILNFLMLLSIFLTFIVCYTLLRELGVNNWFSALFCLGITLLSPQIFRLGGHLALSYSIAIPLSWLILLKSLRKAGNLYYPVLLFLVILLWLFIHAYLGVIIIFFLALIVVGKYLFDKTRKKNLYHYLILISAVFTPLLIFYLFAHFTDTHTGRTDNPSGFFNYSAEPDDVFLPNHAPLRPVFDLLTGNSIKQEWEALSYVGITTSLLFVAIFFLSIVKLFRRKRAGFLNIFFRSEILNISLAAAFIVLLFAMAFPFKQFPALLDFFPAIKQFRATGRFTWPFYFAATTFTAVAMQEIYQAVTQNKKKILVVSFCVIVGVFNIVEGLPYHLEARNYIKKSENVFKAEYLTASLKTAIYTVKPVDYQAIIALPFYYQGSENFSRPKNEETMRASIIMSYHTGIPIVCANLTRTSVQESKKIIQLVSPDFYIKEIRNDFPNNKPFLIVRTKDKITEYEEDILRKCKPVYMSNDISIYSLTKEDLFKNNAQTIIDKFTKLKPNLNQREGFYTSDATSYLYFNGFEKSKSDKPFREKGGLQTPKAGKNTLAEFAPNTFLNGTKYTVSVWMYNGSKDALNNWLRFIIEEYDEQKDEWTSTTYFPENSEVINGDWSLVEGTFEIKDPKNRIYIVTKGTESSKGTLYMDELLIRQIGLDVYSMNPNGNKLFFNNHEIVLNYSTH